MASIFSVYIVVTILCSAMGGMKMPRKPLFNGPVMTFVRKHKLVRKIALVGGIVVGLYFAGVAMGWWPNILG